MMSDQDQKKYFRDHQFTLKGRIFYPALLTPKTNREGTKTNYNVMFAWKAEDNAKEMEKLNAFLADAYKKFFSTVPMQFFVNPVKKFETYMRQDGKPNPEYLRGHYWVNAATGIQVPPVVCKQTPMGLVNLTAEKDEAEVYSGRNAVIQISFYKIMSQKQGLSTNVNAVMLMEGGQKEGGVGSVDVNKIFGGFAQDMGMDTPPAFNNPTSGGDVGGGFV